MSQRNSGYERKERDLYETPEWVTEALIPFIPDRIKWICEPAAGSGKMAAVLINAGYKVLQSDIYPSNNLDDVVDFGNVYRLETGLSAVVTNPPYDQAQSFVQHALHLAKMQDGFVAMLLRVDFDSAKTRRHLFADNPAWSKKIVLTDRIRWFEGGSSPSFNHAWYVFDHTHEGPATLHYSGKDSK